MHSRRCCHPHFPAPLLLENGLSQDPLDRMEGSSQNHSRGVGERKIPIESSNGEKVRKSDRRSNAERKKCDLSWCDSLCFFLYFFIFIASTLLWIP
jgi:hypothetical protein